MKKLIFQGLFTLAFFGVVAQTSPAQQQKKELFNKVDRLVANYIKYSSFLEPGKSSVSANSLRDFRMLFTAENINLPDEMTPAYFEQQKTKIAVPSLALLDKEATALKGRLPIFNENYSRSLSAMQQYQQSLSSYRIDYGRQRVAFYEAHELISKNLQQYESALIHQEDIVTCSLPVFLEKVAAIYPEGFSVRMLNSAVSFKNIDNKEVNVLVEKITEGKMSGTALKFENHDTLLLALHVNDDYSTVKIASIEMLGYQLKFLNDKDRDFIADSKDVCPETKGLFSLNGCPSPEEKNINNRMNDIVAAWKLDSLNLLAAEVGANTKTKMLEDRVAFLQNKVGEPANTWVTFGLNGGSVLSTLTNSDNNYLNNIQQNEINATTSFKGGKSLGGDILLEHYFGQKAVFGISLGLSYSSSSGTLNKAAFHVEYQASDRRNNIYRQHITATETMKEKISATNLSVPLLVAVKTPVSPKIAFKLQVGILLSVSYSTKMISAQSSFDYEAVYKYTTGNNTIFDGAPIPGSTSFLITKEFVANHVGANGVAGYFSGMQANGYPVGLGIPHTAGVLNGTATFGSGMGYIVIPSISYIINNESSINLGGYYSAINLKQTGNGYRLIDENFQYQTMMQGVSKIINSNFGIRLSYTHSLFYNSSKWIKELSGIR
ncbi:MAG: outer membrane beta-barrel protein [Ferruginibacter sp.]